MSRKKVKFGKRINIFLSNEEIKKADKMSTNRSEFIGKLIIKESKKKKYQNGHKT